ncbi:MAG: hypothetical protein K0S53_502 [Bacteroidetes bacterium]|jgi:hypothetical protein|nr:hypothetical protein [Bacteroidota bacterium]
MEQKEPKGERVRKVTSDKSNSKIDQFIVENINKYSVSSSTISKRIVELDKMWDIERILEINMSVISLTGIALSIFVNVYWLILPCIVLLFFVQHAIQGWCPPIPIFRSFKVRTRPEIDREKYALKALRGDFAGIESNEPYQAFNAVRKI